MDERRNEERIRIERKRQEDEQKVKDHQNKRQKIHRSVTNKSDRLRQFREATMYNAIFICTCCQQRMFNSNVRLYTDELKEDFERKIIVKIVYMIS